MRYPLISHLSSLEAFQLTTNIISLSISLIAQPAPSNLANGCASELQPEPSRAQLGLFPPESQHVLEEVEEPPVDEIPMLQYYPQSSTEGLGPSPEVDMKQGVVSPARPQQEHSLNRFSQSSLHPEVLDFQERLSRPSSGTSSEMGDRPVTTQPGPLELDNPLAPENRQGERSRVQPASLDGQNPGDGPPKPVEPEREGRDGQLEKHSPPGTGNGRKWIRWCCCCCPCFCR